MPRSFETVVDFNPGSLDCHLSLCPFAENGWDVETATNTYRFMEQAMIPPPGPLKNVEPKLVSNTSSSGVTAASSGVTASSSVTPPSVNALQGAAPSMSFPSTLSKSSRRFGFSSRSLGHMMFCLAGTTQEASMIREQGYQLNCPTRSCFLGSSREPKHQLRSKVS